MKLTPLLTGLALTSLLTTIDVPVFHAVGFSDQAIAAEMKDTTGLTPAQKIEMLTKNKGQFGSGDQLRRFFFGDLEPLAVQPGGAGMVVNLYNKTNNVTFSYCATYDVVVAVKKGRVARFADSEVK